MNVSLSLKERVLSSAAATPSLTRHQGRRLAAALIALSVGVAAVVLALQRGHSPPPHLVVHLADGGALASSYLTWLVVGRGGMTRARSRRALSAVTLAFPVCLFAWMQRFDAGPGAPLESDALRCALDILAIGVTPLASFLALRRAVEPSYPGILGGAAGAMCAAWANTLAFLVCPIAGGLHAIVGHVVPSALLIAVGAVIGARTLGGSER